MGVNSIPGYATLAEFAREHDVPYMTVKNHMRVGRCKFPRRRISGRSKDPAYKCWEAMIQRCINPKATRYNRYGGRGISVDPLWIQSFEKFIEDVGPRPDKEHTLDRIDNDGNYVPGNVRWANKYQQAQNQSRSPGYIHKHGKSWRVQIKRNGERYNYPGFTSQEEAQDWLDTQIREGHW